MNILFVTISLTRTKGIKKTFTVAKGTELALPPITRILFEHEKYGQATEVGVCHGVGVTAKRDFKFDLSVKQVTLFALDLLQKCYKFAINVLFICCIFALVML